MKTILSFLTLFLILFVTSCSSISTTTDYDPSVDFTKYKTYKWFTGEMPADDELGKSPLAKRRFEHAVDKALNSKGYTKEEADTSDFIVIIHAGTKERMQVSTYDYGGYGYGRYGYGWGGYGSGMTTTDINYYDEATLIIDIIDSEKKELVWRGTATGVVSKKTNIEQEELQRNADEITSKILEKFPPQPKK